MALTHAQIEGRILRLAHGDLASQPPSLALAMAWEASLAMDAPSPKVAEALMACEDDALKAIGLRGAMELPDPWPTLRSGLSDWNLEADRLFPYVVHHPEAEPPLVLWLIPFLSQPAPEALAKAVDLAGPGEAWMFKPGTRATPEAAAQIAAAERQLSEKLEPLRGALKLTAPALGGAVKISKDPP